MKLVWKKKGDERGKKRSRADSSAAMNPKLPFESAEEVAGGELENNSSRAEPDLQGGDPGQLAEIFQSQGNQLVEYGKFAEALRKWEAALALTPNKAILHEQKAQVLLEIGDAWGALKAATRATELEPSWAEAWITLGRAQLNFGEPDSSLESFNRALAIKPDNKEALADQETATHLVKRRKQLHSSGLSTTTSRYSVGDKFEI